MVNQSAHGRHYSPPGTAGMIWRPIALSGKHRKAMDRRFGADLILPWPPGLPIAGKPLDLDEERDATPAEHKAAVTIVGAACAAEGLIPVRSSVAMLTRPPSLPREGQIEPHLIVRIVGSRWIEASLRQRRQPGGECWYAGEIEAA